MNKLRIMIDDVPNPIPFLTSEFYQVVELTDHGILVEKWEGGIRGVEIEIMAPEEMTLSIEREIIPFTDRVACRYKLTRKI